MAQAAPPLAQGWSPRKPSPPAVDIKLKSQLGHEIMLPSPSVLSLTTIWLLSALTYFSKRRLLIGGLQMGPYDFTYVWNLKMKTNE